MALGGPATDTGLGLAAKVSMDVLLDLAECQNDARLLPRIWNFANMICSRWKQRGNNYFKNTAISGSNLEVPLSFP